MFVVHGDVVYGMANAAMPFVGRVGDPADGPARWIVEPMLAAAEFLPLDSRPPIGRQCRLTINGMPVATAESVASTEAEIPVQARPLSLSRNIRLNGKPLLLHGGAFIASPDGSLQSLAVTQGVAFGPYIPPEPGAEPPEMPEIVTDGSGLGADSGQVRTRYEDPSAEHVMVSRCSSDRIKDLLPPEYAVLVGDPVDVATGAVVTDAVDDRWVVPNLTFERRYTSNRSDRSGPFGFGWSHNFDQAIWLEPGRVVLLQDGREIEFDCFALPDRVARAGATLHDLTGRLTLICHGRNAWELSDGTATRHFLPIPGTSSQDRDRGLSRLSTIVRPDEPLVELEYDDKARLSAVRADGRSIFTFRYDGEGLIESLSGSVMRYRYSAAGDLIEASDIDKNARKYTYDDHLLVRETNRRGGEFFYGYDGHGAKARCIRTWGTDGRLHRVLAYESSATLVTDSLGERTIYQTSPLGLVLGKEGPMGDAEAYRYDDRLRLTHTRHPDGTSEADLYDEKTGRRSKHRGRDGCVWRMQHDHAGRLIEGLDPTGGCWRFTHDVDGRLSRVEDPLGHVTRLEYQQQRLHKIVDPLGRVTSVRLGAHDEVLALRAPGRPAMRFEYDEQGRLSVASNEYGDETRWLYDTFGQLVSTVRAGISTHWRRDAEGSVTAVERGDQQLVLQRDPFGRLLGIRRGDSQLGYRYDSEDRLLWVTESDRVRVELRRDARGLVEGYTLDGALEGIVNRTGHSAGGSAGRRTQISSLREGDVSISIAWDEGGRIAEFDAGEGPRTFTYREDGLLLSHATPEHTCTLTRDALGVVTKQQSKRQTEQRCVESAHVDFRGERYGLDVGDDYSVSYLRGGLADSPNGALAQLERIAVVADVPFEIAIGASADGSWGVARYAGGEFEFPCAPARIQFQGQPDAPQDALHRPLQGPNDVALLWDEDRLLLEGTRLHVRDPRFGHRLGTTHPEGFELCEAASKDAAAAGVQGPTAQALAACWLDGKLGDAGYADGQDAVVNTPLGILQQVFARRVWNPTPRPLPGVHPWQPDDWQAPVLDPKVAEFRLDRETLMRLLSPFPRPLLRMPQSQ